MRYLFVHAHPDDETLSSGAIICCLVADGHQCLVLTATRGEMGDPIPGVLQPGEELGTARMRERAQALTALGAEDAGWLGTIPNRVQGKPERIYCDSGMTWLTPTYAGPSDAASPDSLYRAELSEVAADVEAAVRHHGAEIVVSYDSRGGYGHPDHVRCHEATVAVAAKLGLPCCEIVSDPEDNRIGGTHSSSMKWFGVPSTHENLMAAHRAYRTQFFVDTERVYHGGGQVTSVGYCQGLRRRESPCTLVEYGE